jgi:hypothetical protein
VRRAYLSLTLIAPLAAVLVGPFLLYQVAVRDWSSSLFIGSFLVWLGGLLGVLGLCSCTLEPDGSDYVSPRRISYFLLAGVLAALSVLWFYLFSELSGSDSGRRWLMWQNWAVVFVLSMNPIFAAAVEVVRLTSQAEE